MGQLFIDNSKLFIFITAFSLIVHRSIFTSGFRFFGFGPRFLGRVSLSSLNYTNKE